MFRLGQAWAELRRAHRDTSGAAHRGGCMRNRGTSRGGAVLVGVLLMGGCSLEGVQLSRSPADAQEASSELQYMLTDELDKAEILAVIANTPLVIVVNLATNRSTIIKEGTVIDAWNSATADVTGEWHVRDGVLESQVTPPGIYTVHDIEHCPAWLPNRPAGLKLTGDDAKDYLARRKIFAEQAHLYGPCGASNPLGEFALWFWSEYGYHGTTTQASYILDLPADERYVSGGCVRNPPHKIEKVYSIILNELADGPEYQAEVVANRQAGTPATLTRDISEDYRVMMVVGEFRRDLPFHQLGSTINTVQLDRLSACTIVHSQAPIYPQSRFGGQEVIGYYNKGDVITALSEVNIDKRYPIKTDKGWISAYYVADTCRPGVHYWKQVSIEQPYASCHLGNIDCGLQHDIATLATTSAEPVAYE